MENGRWDLSRMHVWLYKYDRVNGLPWEMLKVAKRTEAPHLSDWGRIGIGAKEKAHKGWVSFFWCLNSWKEKSPVRGFYYGY